MKNLIICGIIFFFGGITNVLIGQENDEEYVLKVLEKITFSTYRIGSTDNFLKSDAQSPGTYIQSNVTCDERKKLSEIPLSTYLLLLDSNSQIGINICILLYDMTQIEATPFYFFSGEFWTDGVWEAEKKYWKEKADRIQFKTSGFRCDLN